MRTQRTGIAIALLLLITTTLQAQRSAGRGMGGNGQGQMSRQQQGPVQQQGSGQQPRSPQQLLVQSQATDRQRTTMKQITAATKQLRIELRQMTRLKSTQQVRAETAKLWRARIRTQRHVLQQQQEILISSLTQDQQLWAADDIQQLTLTTTGLVDKLEALDIALAEDDVDEPDVKQAAKEADGKTKDVESKNQTILDVLGL